MPTAAAWVILGRKVRGEPRAALAELRQAGVLVGGSAVLQRDAATVGEEQLVERAQFVVATVDARRSGRIHALAERLAIMDSLRAGDLRIRSVAGGLLSKTLRAHGRRPRGLGTDGLHAA